MNMQQASAIVNGAAQSESATVDCTEEEREGNGEGTSIEQLPNGTASSASATNRPHKRKLSTDSAATDASTPSASTSASACASASVSAAASARRKPASDSVGGPSSSKRLRQSPLAAPATPASTSAPTMDVDESSQQSSLPPPSTATADEVPADPADPASILNCIEEEVTTAKASALAGHTEDKETDAKKTESSFSEPKPKQEPTIKVQYSTRLLVLLSDGI